MIAPDADEDAIIRLFAQRNSRKQFAAFKASVPAPDAENLNRVTLTIDDGSLAPRSWEREVSERLKAQDVLIVRLSPVRPRIAQILFTTPLRLLQIGNLGFDLAKAVQLTLGEPDPRKLARMLLLHSADMAAVAEFLIPASWRTADVVHIRAEHMPSEGHLRTAQSHRVGTLGWCCRAAELWRTRLFILEAGDAAAVERARAVAAALVARGGPAVLIGPPGNPQQFYRRFYRALVLDHPIDEALAQAIPSDPKFSRDRLSLFVGAGREELIRMSAPARGLYDIAERLTTKDARRRRYAAMDLWSSLSWPGDNVTTKTDRFWNSVKALDRLRSNSQIRGLDVHESQNLAPFSDDIAAIRRAALPKSIHFARKVPFRLKSAPALRLPRSTWQIGRLDLGKTKGFGPARRDLAAIRRLDLPNTKDFIPLAQDVAVLRGWTRATPVVEEPSYMRLRFLGPPSAIAPLSQPPTQRFVNPSLLRLTKDGSTERVDPKGEPLVPGQPVLLSIHIGPKDSVVSILEARALIEEPFKWRPGQKGVWLTIGVSGIDFTVLGDPVQELWLPRADISDRVEFTVVPRTARPSFLRFCVYCGSDLLQSFRLAAVVGNRFGEPSFARAALAALLGTDAKKVSDTAYATRLEYAATQDLVDVPTRQDVALSIFANAVNGLTVVTARGKEEFSVAIGKGVASIGDRIRQSLDEGSSRLVGTEKLYAFTKMAKGYEGSWDHVDGALRKLAGPGWDLFSKVIPEPEKRAKLQAELEGPPGIIHVGHAQPENNLPWALIYDREYDEDQRRVENLPALHITCRAGLDKAETGLPPSCGQHPDCPLSPKQLETQRARGQLACPQTVVCPRHFWGFRHRIELPAMQVNVSQRGATRSEKILAKTPAGLVIGYNAKLTRAKPHIDQVRAALANFKIKSKILLETTDRDALKQGLAATNIDLVYLFCHARGGRADPKVDPPRLELQGETDPRPGYIQASALRNFAWADAPLVFFNGCNTAAFSPDALSPFIEAVVLDCKAAGAIGTEIPVFQELAEEFGALFLTRFLNKQPAGQALLDARLEMLSRLNPLGLAYTLFAFSDLLIDQSNV